MNEQDILYYGIYSTPLQEKQQIILQEIHKILDELTTDPEHAPAEHIRSRIKSSESIVEKLERRGLDTGVETGLAYLSDAIGLRIVTHFVGDVYSILEKIKKSNLWSVVNVKDYISNPKPNGYRSLHIILKIPFEVGNFTEIEAEIQLRTIAMDCWASLEHQLKYKKNIKETQLIVEELKRCSDEMASTDLTMQTIRDLIQSQ